MGFNKEQLEVINNNINGAMLVSASAGCGKSHTLIGRIKYMVESGINPSDITITTFTNDSATDLKKKLDKECIFSVNVGTFHSLCRNILIKEGYNIDKRPPANYIFQNRFKALRLDKKILTNDIRSWISFQKNYGLNSSSPTFMDKDIDYDEYNLRMYFKEYEKIMEEYKCYDYEDWLLLAINVLLQDFEEKYTTKYLMIDEFQDSNVLQVKLMQLLCPSKNVVVVGDEKQCLLPDTKILTVDGEKEIKDITTDDTLIVASGKGTTYQHRATELLSRNYEGEILTIKTKSGKEIRCTPNHGFFVKDTINDYVKTTNNIEFSIFAGEQIEKTEDYLGYSHTLKYHMIDETFREIKRTGSNMDSLYILATEIEDLRPQNVLRYTAMITNNGEMVLYPASNIRCGMKLPIYQDGVMIEDEVISIARTQYKGLVYDINVDNYRNYIADGICVHNCLYAFRGSNHGIMENFTKLYPNAKVVRLKTNYRSCKNLVEQGNVFARYYFGDSDLYADAESHNQTDGIIDTMAFENEDAQAIHVVRKVEQWLNEGVEPNDIAILYRNNKNAFEIENELKCKGIDYSISGNNSFFERTESKILLAILRLIQNTKDDSAVEELLMYRVDTLKYIKKPVGADIIDEADRRNIPLFKVCSSYSKADYNTKRNLDTFVNNIKDLIVLHNDGLDLYSLVKKIIRLFNIVDYVENKYEEQEQIEERLESIDSFTKFIKGNTLDSFLTFVYTDIAQGNKKKKTSKDQIMLRTVHASKGLEWKKVILVSVENDKFPNKKADIYDEACCMYVAVTRAEEEFVLCELGMGNTFTENYFEE